MITDAQLNADGKPINDCLGHPDGSMVDNIEDVDTVVGWLAEIDPAARIRDLRDAVPSVHSQRVAPAVQRPFFTSSFRPEFYSTLGVRLGQRTTAPTEA